MLYEEDYDITWARLSEEKEGKRSSLDLLFSLRDARHVPRKEEKKEMLSGMRTTRSNEEFSLLPIRRYERKRTRRNIDSTGGGE